VGSQSENAARGNKAVSAKKGNKIAKSDNHALTIKLAFHMFFPFRVRVSFTRNEGSAINTSYFYS
jgi:hypothetical protein